jgi:RimJ/RimL family protein N-acetyltransferase
MALLPLEIRTTRLLLRPWCCEDAASLCPILEANWDHLRWWIPARIATPAPAPVLAERLAGFASDFAADREWRFAMLTRDDGKLLGEVGLFPRSAAGRVPAPDADRAELGYWLRVDETGRGFATEAAMALASAAAAIPRFSHLEIRCDPRNVASAAIPKRLGFTLMDTVTQPGDEPRCTQIWMSAPLTGNSAC